MDGGKCSEAKVGTPYAISLTTPRGILQPFLSTKNTGALGCPLVWSVIKIRSVYALRQVLIGSVDPQRRCPRLRPSIVLESVDLAGCCTEIVAAG